jgi:c-di-GMP-binding flagellar brake protein YcgR
MITDRKMPSPNSPRAQGASRDASLDDGDERFTIREPAEIAFVLKKVMQNGQLVTAYLDGGSNFALTSVLAVRPEAGDVILDRCPDSAAFSRLVAARKVLLTTSHDQVRVKFSARNVREVRYEGRPAVRIPMPNWLVRIQRREHYRIATPITKPLVCTIPLPAHGPGMQAETIVLDISVGGLALMDNHEAPGFKLGDIYEQCRIGLPEVGTLTVSVEVRNAFDTPLKNGLSFRRCGCKFLDLGKAENLVQRYILLLERARNYRTGK